MNPLHAYLPQDRRLALSLGKQLPDHVRGTAMLADISGFTPLTEKLVHSLGAKRGAEELTIHLNRVYDALIKPVEAYGGSVIGFAGDAITCWFDDGDRCGGVRWPPAVYAIASALKMQAAMRTFPDQALKISLATGVARRFVIGNHQIQLLDTIAGATLARMAEGEHLAQRGEILADEATLLEAAETVRVGEFRKMSTSLEKFAVVEMLTASILPQPLPTPTNEFDTRPWLLPAVYEREQAGLGAFLTELRNVVALFLRFEGIDYDNDAVAGEKLDAFIRRVQDIIIHHGSTLLDLTIGDKGSYLYVSFGAPVAHEDNALRAVQAALDLQHLPQELGFLLPVQIGISLGIMCVGAYGSATRRTYGVLGDEMNLAARLMQVAMPGQILVSGRVQASTAESFRWNPLTPILLKGKSSLVPVFELSGLGQTQPVRLVEPAYSLPMIGRQAELALAGEKMQLALQGKGQILGITAEAGVGKSRLVAEIVGAARGMNFTGYAGQCQSYGVNTPYLAWHSIWQAFFEVFPGQSPEQQELAVRARVSSLAPTRLEAAPLLGLALNIPLVENDFTRSLEPKERKSALEALLRDCMRTAAEAARSCGSALLFVLEDWHWVDPLSRDLLEELALGCLGLPVLIVMVYRPLDIDRLPGSKVEDLPHFTRIALAELEIDEVKQLIQAKLGRWFAEQDEWVSPALLEVLTGRAQGNPFYLEELLNYLYDRGIDLRKVENSDNLSFDLPDSLQTLVLSRIDQLTEQQKAIIKTASVIGRVFSLNWLYGYYPALGFPDILKFNLVEMARLDLTPLNTPEPDLTYIFKHIITQEVAYGSLPYAQRAQLHELLAEFIETLGDEEHYLDLLAFHYEHSENLLKKRKYLQKAGEAAQKNYANNVAVTYYDRLLPLLVDPLEYIDVLLMQGHALLLSGKWENAESAYRSALVQAVEARDLSSIARSQVALGKLCRLRGDYDIASEILVHARTNWEALENLAGVAEVLIESGIISMRQGDYILARECLEKALSLAGQQNTPTLAGLALNNLGSVAYRQGELDMAQAYYQRSLALRHRLNDKPGLAATLGNLGNIANDRGDYQAARELYGESLMIKRQIGDKLGIAGTLNNMTTLSDGLDSPSVVWGMLEESLALYRELGDKQGISIVLNNLGELAFTNGDYANARALFDESLSLKQVMGDSWGLACGYLNLGAIAKQQGNQPQHREMLKASLKIFHELGDKWGMIITLVDFAEIALADGLFYDAAQLASVIETARQSVGLALESNYQEAYQRVVTELKAVLGEAEFKTVWMESTKVDLDQTVVNILDKELPHLL